MIIPEGRRKKEEGRRKKEEGRRKKEEGRRKKSLVISHQCCRLRAFRTTSSGRRKKRWLSQAGDANFPLNLIK
ncbi:hypothetical protein QT998_23275 [Microcoleus sp. S1D4]|uniref:hypothetical protein n=1 Tax=Microcoleus sp. S1D4 TaxID=3055413 RepID=UPI002FCE98B1